MTGQGINEPSTLTPRGQRQTDNAGPDHRMGEDLCQVTYPSSPGEMRAQTRGAGSEDEIWSPPNDPRGNKQQRQDPSQTSALTQHHWALPPTATPWTCMLDLCCGGLAWRLSERTSLTGGQWGQRAFIARGLGGGRSPTLQPCLGCPPLPASPCTLAGLCLPTSLIRGFRPSSKAVGGHMLAACTQRCRNHGPF